MKQFWIIAISCAVFGNASLSQDVLLSLPENLIIGAGSASYQVEGAWNVSDKSESVWDRWAHDKKEFIAGEVNGDISTNFYYKYKEDVQLIKSTGLQFFRFSISWPRVLPTGFTNAISKDGLQFYKNLTAELRANGIEPVVTLYHWDHPQVLEDFGGWTNELMIDWFVSYARVIFEALGDSVKIWITFNEPNFYCQNSYGHTEVYLAPGKNLTDIGKYMCVHNILKAHAKTYHMYNKRFRATQRGEIGLVANCVSFEAANSSDTKSVETEFQFYIGWVYNPIVNGDYPEIMKTRIAMISKAQGYEKSRLPEFSEEWISLIKGSVDYFGINYYGGLLVSPDPDEAKGIYNTDSGLVQSANSSWPRTAMADLYVTPAGFGLILRQIRDKYDNPPVRVMENGYPGYDVLEDYDRIRFHYDYMTELIKAIKQDGCNVRSYSIWSLLDDFEWNSGYVPKFGIFRVDFNDPDRPRTPKLSVSWWKNVLQRRELLPICAMSDF